MAVRFTKNRGFDRDVSSEAEMRRFLGRVADDAAAEVERRAPRWIKRAGARIQGEVVTSSSGLEAEVQVDSPFWHLPEFGSVNNAPTPYLRPGVQATLSKYGGRMGPSNR